MKKLTPKQFEETLKILRLWPAMQRDVLAPLIHSYKLLEEELQAAHRLIDTLQQPRLGSNPQPLPSKSASLATSATSAPRQAEPLKDRLRAMVANGERGGAAWAVTLKWNRMTEEDADDLLAQQTGKGIHNGSD